MIRSMKHETKQKLKMCAGILLFCLVLGGAVCRDGTISNAATVTVGTVAASSLNVRSGPGTQYPVVGYLSQGDQITILAEASGQDVQGDNIWYQIQEKPGYVARKHIKDVHTVEQTPSDENYINELMNKGFPRSYAVLLDQLHRQRPNWVFEPVNTNLDWNDVIAAESRLGWNLVQAGNDDSQKSTEPGAYDWATNQWYGKDGAGWVCASSDMIRYCMDPRNFLNPENIFQFATNEYQDYQNATGVTALLQNTFMTQIDANSGFLDTDNIQRTYKDTFVEVGQSTDVQVNPYHLAARCRQEQGVNGTSGSISGKVSGYEGYFNYFNIGAFPANGRDSVTNGLIRAKNEGWNSRYLSILGGSKIVGNNYVKVGQNTVYFEKFNVVNAKPGLYNHQYMTNVQAAISEGKSMKKAYDNNANILFRIPVYNNMPDTPQPMPNSGNPNNWIKSLTIQGYSLTPGFDSAKTDYSLIVDSTVASVTISADPVAKGASVSGTGTVNLNYGNNTVTVNCTAQNGDLRAYTLNIVRQHPSGVARGDVDGDGTIALKDYVMVKRHILGYEILSGNSLMAADVDGDGAIALKDYVMIKRHILGYEKIE